MKLIWWISNRIKWLEIEIETRRAITMNDFPQGVHPSVWVSRQKVRQKKALEGFDI